MQWLLVGCCGLALVNLSVALNPTWVIQNPRFYGVKKGQHVHFYCKSSDHKALSSESVQWYKASEYDMEAAKRTKLSRGKSVTIKLNNNFTQASIIIFNTTTEDSGVYYCKINDTVGAGTELQVVRPFHVKKAEYRSQMKDGLIFLQALLLAICIVAPFIRNSILLNKEDVIYEEPEQDHIYEGLAIETCGGGLYEDISVYAQPGGAEACWEQD
ncbi:B-cell antigen receptor complex-associated protein beta chain [Polymixia lowei]